jgi:hypothetical protein
MSNSQLRARIAAMHAEASAIGGELAARASEMEADELFEVSGELQGAANAVEGAQLVAMAHAASHESRLTGRGPVEVHHGPGFVDAMAPSLVSLEAGIGEWAAGRRVSLAAKSSERFPRLLGKVVAGELTTATIAKVVSVCDGLDLEACARVEDVLLDRLPGLDPARVTGVIRKVATRIAADQMRETTKKNRKDRYVEVCAGPDGTTLWSAQLPTGPSAAMWDAIKRHGDSLAQDNPSLTLDQARADALADLVLSNVTVTAKVTLGIPVITGTDAVEARDAAVASAAADGRPVGMAGAGLGDDFSVLAALNGCDVPSIGFIDADTVEALLAVVPTDIGRALLDARTGTLMESVTNAYRPPRAMTDFVATRDGTCRMWGCTRPAMACDTDHARPWPAGRTTPTNLGGLCRRHHRLKQRRRWAYQLDPDGTVSWTSPKGKRRMTYPQLAYWPPLDAAPPEPAPQPAAVSTPAPDDPPPF